MGSKIAADVAEQPARAEPPGTILLEESKGPCICPPYCPL
jgi:hypothetical protein